MLIFVLLFSLDILENMIRVSESQKRRIVAYQVLQEQLSHWKQGESFVRHNLSEPFPMKIELVNERVCVSYEEANQKSQSICSP